MAVSVESKSSRVLSLFAFIVTFALFSAVDAETGSSTSPPPVAPTTTTAVERRCILYYGGNLAMFNGEWTEVKVPCKYRLANITCGDYRVKVTPGSSVDAEARYFHVTAWIEVVNTVTGETVELRTSLRRLQRAEAGTIDNAWKIKEGNTSFLDFAGYDGGIARLEKDGVFTVQFSNNSVQVSCVAPDFSSPGVPETLCGDGSTVDEVETALVGLLGDESYLDLEEFLQYIILNDTTVTQSKNCVALTNNFQQCEVTESLLLRCSGYFSSLFWVGCLIGNDIAPEDVYDYCVRSSCYNDESNKPDIGNSCEG